MSTPIKREDIRKGDRVREIREYTATVNHFVDAYPGNTYELIERPVQLPTVEGHYVDNRGVVWKLEDGHWECGGGWLGAEAMENFAPLTRVRPVAEVAAEVLGNVWEQFTPFEPMWRAQFKGIAKEYGVTL